MAVISKGVIHTGLHGLAAYRVLSDVLLYEMDNPSELKPFWQVDSLYDDIHFFFQYPLKSEVRHGEWWTIVRHLNIIKSNMDWQNSESVVYQKMIRSHTTFSDDGEIVFPFYSDWKTAEEVNDRSHTIYFYNHLVNRIDFFWERLNMKWKGPDIDNYYKYLGMTADETKALFSHLKNYFRRLSRGYDFDYYKSSSDVWKNSIKGLPFNPMQSAFWQHCSDEAHSLLQVASLQIFSGQMGKRDIEEIFDKLTGLYWQALDIIQ